MSRNARHEIIMNGIENDAYIQRTLVLDCMFQPRHVHKLHKNFEKRLERTSQIAYANDYVIESTLDLTTKIVTRKYFVLTGPVQVATGHPQLCREEISNHGDDDWNEFFKSYHDTMEEYDQKMYDFLLYNDTNVIQPAMLPTFWGWNGAIGMIEEKQSSYIMDLLGGAPTVLIDTLAMEARYSKRNHIEPFNRLPLPSRLDSSHNPVSNEINPDPNSTIYWIIYLNDGKVDVVYEVDIDTYDYKPEETKTAIKLYTGAYAQEDGTSYGLMLEIFLASVPALEPHLPRPTLTVPTTQAPV